jgi:pyruvate dehydrogenase E1 component
LLINPGFNEFQDGLRRMHELGEDIFYYLTVYNETYAMRPLPGNSGADHEHARTGVLRGLYKVQPADKPGKLPRVHLFGSGPLLNEALRAQQLLRDQYKVAADVWSATSYNELYRDALLCERWNRLHPTEPARVPFFRQALGDDAWPIVTTSDYISAVALRLAPWAPAGLTALGTDGFGRSDSRAALRRHFETDAEHVVVAALAELVRRGQVETRVLAKAINDLGLDPEQTPAALA